jgi:rod shape-determining protein MreC
MKQYINYDQGSKVNLSIYYYISHLFKKIEFILLIVACLILIGLSKSNEQFYQKTSSFFINISLPISKLVAFPFSISGNFINYTQDLASAKTQNIALRVENAELKDLYIKALNISQENEELKDLIKFIDIRSVKYKSVRLITKLNKPYDSGIIINAGSDQGISQNNIITGKNSILGRVTQVGSDWSKVLAITDENSRIPVITTRSRTRGVLVGRNSKVMTIDYLDKDHKIKVGDAVFTSGDGEHLTPGLLAGVVTKVRGKRVEVVSPQRTYDANLVAISKY